MSLLTRCAETWESYVELTLKQNPNPEISICELLEIGLHPISLALCLPQSMWWINYTLHMYGTECRELKKMINDYHIDEEVEVVINSL